ncbi:hypothetical protein HZ326_15339 [Fusarium oxysporum f. sp. albedinis]|nr:hypothetical protein HZ326_15339 [Fusarium oxysporum f. sp. albedinis]
MAFLGQVGKGREEQSRHSQVSQPMSPAESHACVWCLNVLGPLVLEACLVLCNLQPTAGIESGKAPPPVCKTPPRPVRIDGAVVCLGTLLHEFLGNVPLAPSWSCN